MTKDKKERIIEVTIDDLSSKGSGVGSFTLSNGHESHLEVPFAIPGDHLLVSLSSKKRGFYQGSLIEILKPSADRIQPRCIHFGSCGGCRFQQIGYQQQLQIKEEAIRKLFQDLLPPNAFFREIIGSDSSWGYRNKMEFSFSSNKVGERFLGLILQGSRGRVFHLNECYITQEWFVEALKATREWWNTTKLPAYYPPQNKGLLRTLTLREGRRSGDRLAMLTVSGNPEYAPHKKEIDFWVASMRKAIEPKTEKEGRLALFLRIQQAVKGEETQFYEMELHGQDHIRETLSINLGNGRVEDLNFSISPSAFFQPNSQQAEKIYSHALRMAKIEADSVVYDLYCGTGTLGICAAKQAKQVIGIELSPEASLDARQNALQNGVNNIQILTGHVEVILKKEEFSLLPPPDVVFLDPPRTGLYLKGIDLVLQLQPKKIIYISCNPKTQAQDSRSFLQHGYQIKEIQPIDQFPQTPHAENIVLFVRNL